MLQCNIAVCQGVPPGLLPGLSGCAMPAYGCCEVGRVCYKRMFLVCPWKGEPEMTENRVHQTKSRQLPQYRRVLLGIGLIAMTTALSACSTVADWVDAINPFD